MIANERLANAYRIIGIPPGASARELKKAFHDKAMKYHPDLNPSPAASEEFKNITHAYDIIKDHLRKQKKSAPAPRPAPKVQTTKMRESQPHVGEMNFMLPVSELMFRVANSQNVYVRIHAIRALAGLGGRDAAWCLIRALNDPESGVRAEAAAALGRMRAKFAVMPLIRLHKSSDEKTAAVIFEALEIIGSPMARKYIAALNAEKQPKTKTASFGGPDIA